MFSGHGHDQTSRSHDDKFWCDAVSWLKSESEVGKTSYGYGYGTVAKKETTWMGNCK